MTAPVTAPAIPGDPAALDAAADAVDRAVKALAGTRDALGDHGRGATATWSGVASSAAAASLARSGTDTTALVDTCIGCAPSLRAFAVELRAAQLQHVGAAPQAAAGQALVRGAGSGAPVGVDAGREQGETAVRDAGVAMGAARERARVANEAAARQIDAAAQHLDGIAPPSTPPATPAGTSTGHGVADSAAAVGNIAASVGNAALHDPLSVGAVLAGGALTAVSAVGFAGGAVADATGVGAVVGLPAGAASAAGIAAGVGIAGAGIAGLAHHALTDRRIQPFQVNEDTPEVDPGPGAPAGERIPRVGNPTKSDRVREVPSDEAVRKLFDELSEDAVDEPPASYEGRRVRTPDGTLLGLREDSKSGGPTIDAKLPDGQSWKVHRPKVRTPEDDARDDLLIACYDDWVSLLEAVGWMRDARPEANECELKAATADLLKRLIREELIVGGDLRGGFAAWDLSIEESCFKIEQEWHMPMTELHQGHGWWFASTPAGDEIGRKLTYDDPGRE